MSNAEKISTVLQQHLKSPASSFSIGSFGAIAEFHRDREERLTFDKPDQLTVATARGAIRIVVNEAVQPLAYETLSANPDRWQHGVAFCLPAAKATRDRRYTVTELGPDRNALHKADRNAILFDLGVGATNIDFCVRTDDSPLITLLRKAEGESLLKPISGVRDAVIQASPSRVILSNLGRLEVYQPIGITKTPEGPHTHLLPKLLVSNRTHSADIPIPDKLTPCLALHPPNPLVDQAGRCIPFNLSYLTDFCELLDQWGLREYIREKKELSRAVLHGVVPSEYPGPKTRVTRTALRIALRQMRQQSVFDPHIINWCRYFDPV